MGPTISTVRSTALRHPLDKGLHPSFGGDKDSVDLRAYIPLCSDILNFQPYLLPPAKAIEVSKRILSCLSIRTRLSRQPLHTNQLRGIFTIVYQPYPVGHI